jgi:hypothetical protein
MPGAIAIDAEAIGGLVGDVQMVTGGIPAGRSRSRPPFESGSMKRMAVGSLDAAGSDAPGSGASTDKTRTTIVSLQSADLEHVDYDDDSATSSPPPTPTAAGEVSSLRKPVARWIAVAGGVVAVAAAVAITIAVTGDDGGGARVPIETAPETKSVEPTGLSPPPPPPPVLTIDAAVVEPPAIEPPVVAKPKRPVKPRTGAGVTAKNVDGVNHADEPTRPKKKPRPRKQKTVDGTTLSE